jgi:hypothetical protein
LQTIIIIRRRRRKRRRKRKNKKEEEEEEEERRRRRNFAVSHSRMSGMCLLTTLNLEFQHSKIIKASKSFWQSVPR